MGADDKKNDGTNNNKLDLKKELKSLKVEQAKWTQEPTIFDKLPAHEKPFSIEPLPNERQRIPFKMSDEDRMRRKIYLESQALTDREPIRVPELERQLYNPFRRLYRAPTDKLFKALGPLLGEHRVPLYRFVVPKLFMGYLAGCVLWYNLKYNNPTWEEDKGITLITTRNVYLPEDEKPKPKKKWDYADRSFQSRTVFNDPNKYAY